MSDFFAEKTMLLSIDYMLAVKRFGFCVKVTVLRRLHFVGAHNHTLCNKFLSWMKGLPGGDLSPKAYEGIAYIAVLSPTFGTAEGQMH